MAVLGRLAILWGVLAALIIGGAASLMGWVERIDTTMWVRFAQPVWSEDEDQVAFIRYEINPEDSKKELRNRELWVVSRVDQAARKVASLDQEFQLLGWFDKDKQLILMPTHPKDGFPQVFAVQVADGKLQENRFARSDISLVGVSGGDVFFQRKGVKRNWEVATSQNAPSGEPTPESSPSASPNPTATPAEATGLAVEQLDLLVWTPGQNSIAPVVSFPLDGGEPLDIAQAYPSPDDKWVAIVLKVGKSDLALWLYERETQQLRYCNVKVTARHLRVAWSWDSTALVAASEELDRCDLYACSNVNKAEFTVLRGGAAGRAYQPFWPRGEKEYLLLDRGDVFRFDPQTLRADKIMGRSIEGIRTEEVAISPRGSWAAFHSRDVYDDVLYQYSLKVGKLQTLIKPGGRTAEKDSVLYMLGDGFRQAAGYWTGHPVRAKNSD